MSTAVISYLNKIGHPELKEGWDWQYNTVGDPTNNAWCMPGGKMFFYTGILELTATDDEIVVVMGHEIAQALAGHGNVRMSQATLAHGITSVAGLLAMTDIAPSLGKAILLQSISLGGQ